MTDFSIETKKFLDALDNSKRVLISTHERTDGDDFGVALALWHHLTDSGLQASIVIKGGLPEYLTFLPQAKLAVGEVSGKYDLLITSGCSFLGRIGDENIYSAADTIINLDHHPDNQLFGDVNIVEAKASSVCEVSYKLFRELDFKITPQIATCLLTGLYSDTGSFLYDSVTGDTLKIAAKLIQAGADYNSIIENLFGKKDFQTLKAWGRALRNAKLNEKQEMVYSIVTQEDMEVLGNPQTSVFEGFPEKLITAKEGKFAIFIKQSGDLIKGSLRSEPYKFVDVQKVAKSLGGGGHILASGFAIKGKIKKEDGKWKVEKI